LCGLEQGPVSVCCIYIVMNLEVPLKAGNFFDQLSDYQLLSEIVRHVIRYSCYSRSRLVQFFTVCFVFIYPVGITDLVRRRPTRPSVRERSVTYILICISGCACDKQLSLPSSILR
jgi:hypothetical protein